MALPHSAYWQFFHEQLITGCRANGTLGTNMANSSGATRRPPYVSYPSFKSLMNDFHEHDLPTRIDRSVLTRFSGVVGTQLLTTLRFLGLIDDKSEPTQRLQELSSAYGTGDWAQKLLTVLREEYAPMFQLDLGAATSSHFTETFRRAYPGSDAVSQKCVAFFLGAVRDTGIAVSERVLKGRKPRAANGQPIRRRKLKAEGAAGEGKSDSGSAGAGKDEIPRPWQERLLDKFPPFDPAWSEDVKAKWFESFEKLKK